MGIIETYYLALVFHPNDNWQLLANEFIEGLDRKIRAKRVDYVIHSSNVKFSHLSEHRNHFHLAVSFVVDPPPYFRFCI